MTARWGSFALPLLATALFVESLLHLHRMHRGPSPDSVTLHVVCSCMLAGLAAFALTLSFRESSTTTSWTLFGTVWGTSLTIHAAYLMQYHAAFGDRRLDLLGVVTGAVFAAGIPMVWATAWVRRFTPSSPIVLRQGAVGARLVFGGFLLTGIQEILRLVELGDPTRIFRSGSSLFAVLSVVRLSGRLILFWCAIETLRRSTSEEVLIQRANRIHRLMIGWIGILAVGAILSSRLQNSGPAYSSYFRALALWNGAVYLTLMLTATIALARRRFVIG